MDFPAQLTRETDPHQSTFNTSNLRTLMAQPCQAQIRRGPQPLKKIPRFRAGDNQRGKFGRAVCQAQPLRHVLLQHFEIMPLRRGGSDQREAILGVAQHRHLRQNPAPAVTEISEVHATCFGQGTGDFPAQEFRSPRARQTEP